MRKWMIGLAALGALGLMLASCGGTEEPKADEPKADEPKAVEPKAVDAAATGSPCDQYAKCCPDYADAIGTMPGMTPDLVKLQKDGCAAMDALKGTPGADESCKTALDALKTGAAAYEALPGFTMPASCK